MTNKENTLQDKL